jgi:hypothetical protein
VLRFNFLGKQKRREGGPARSIQTHPPTAVTGVADRMFLTR